MAFADFLDLQTAVIEQVGRPDIADVMPRLVKLAEAGLNRRLRCADQMTTAPVTVSAGSAALPADFLEAIGLFDAAGGELIQQPIHMLKDGASRGHYAIEGGNLICNADADYSLAYYASLPTLTASMTATNWLLAKFPAAYLYAVGYEAAKYARDVEGAQAAKGLFEMEIADVQAADASARYARARVVLPGVTP